jgi:sialidase-1
MNRIPIATGKSTLTKKNTEGVYIHDNAEDMPHLLAGPYVRLSGGRLVTVTRVAEDNSAGVFVSDDDGKTWNARKLFADGKEVRPIPSGALGLTKNGTVVLGFANIAEKSAFDWDPELKDCPDAVLPTYAARSVDGGDTWIDVQKLHDEWTGATRDMIFPSDGSIVFTSMKILHNPGRHTCLTYRSEDDGRSWQASNIIDLGGNGHHGGVTEATLTELSDGRLLQYLRTNWGEFWRTESIDFGRSWHPYGPSGIDASSAPGHLKRLASGRIALIWNRLYPEGETEYEVRGGDGIWSATPVSNFRHELSISFSEDECNSWSMPVVLARNPDSEVSYPCSFESEPGKLWITAWRWKFRIAIREEDFLLS